MIVFAAEQFTTVAAVAPDGNRTATVDSAVIDTKDYQRCTIVAQFGVVTDGEWTVRVSHSATSDGTFNTFSNLAVVTSANDERVIRDDIDLRATERYVKVSIVETEASTTGAKFSAGVLLQKRVA